MADKKQEKDFSKEVDALLPEADGLAKAGKLDESLEKLLVLEKQTRNAADLASTNRVVKTILDQCYQAKDYAKLNSTLTLLSKKHGQLKAVIQTMVDHVYEWLEDVKQAAGTDKWLELLETLRDITEGRIFLEAQRARVTMRLAHYHEGLHKGSPSTDGVSASLQTASELLSGLQVETYSSMDAIEKTEFLLEQMRLLIELASQKDSKEAKDKLAGGEAEWIGAKVCGRKISQDLLKDPKNEVLKLKYHNLMIKHALYHEEYLEGAKHYYELWESPSIKNDTNGQAPKVLEYLVYYIILAPHNNEQSDLLHRIYRRPELSKLEGHKEFMKLFTTLETMRWPGIESQYGRHLKTSPVFSAEKRWEHLHKRVVEHNIRVVAKYYTRITLARLTTLLDLPTRETEETLARLVVSGTVYARIDRPAGIVNFKAERSPEDVMNDWSSDMQKLLGLVEKTWMGVNAAQAAQSRIQANA